MMRAKIITLLAGIFFAGVFYVGALNAQTSGGGSNPNPTFQSVKVSKSGTNNQILFTASGAATGAKNTLVRTAPSGAFAISRSSDASPFATVDQSFIIFRDGVGGSVSQIQIGSAVDNPIFTFAGTGAATFGGTITANGAPVATETSGNFVASFTDACTTTPTDTFGYVKVGNIVVVSKKTGSGFGCTADSIAFRTVTGVVPAAIRPAATINTPVIGDCLDNGIVTRCNLSFLADGTVQWNRVDGGAWNGVGNRTDAGFSGTSFSYYITNP